MELISKPFLDYFLKYFPQPLTLPKALLYLCMELSVSKYAKTVKLTRYAIYKQISDGRLPKGVKTKKIADKIIIVIKTQRP